MDSVASISTVSSILERAANAVGATAQPVTQRIHIRCDDFIEKLHVCSALPYFAPHSFAIAAAADAHLKG